MEIRDINVKMDKSLENLKSELGKLRTGRASTAILDTVNVDYYGAKTPLKNMATISAPEPRLLTIQPWDVSQIEAIEKAIQTADLGLQPNNDGKIIRLQIPPLSEERRLDLVKIVKRVGEDARVSIRMVRREANDQIKKMDLPEDDQRKRQEEIQKVTDENIKKIDTLLQNKRELFPDPEIRVSQI